MKNTRRRRRESDIDLTRIATLLSIFFIIFRIGCLLRMIHTRAIIHEQKQKYGSQWLAYWQKDTSRDYPGQQKQTTLSPSSLFVQYIPSPWERKWRSGIEEFVKTDSICHQLYYDSDLITQLFETTCTNQLKLKKEDNRKEDWCQLDDTTQQPLFFERLSGKIWGSRPSILQKVPSEVAKPIEVVSSANNNAIFSKFLYRDAQNKIIAIEYIEPLISRLRHPLDCCEMAYKKESILKKSPLIGCQVTQRLGTTRTHIIPPLRHQQYKQFHYFHVGNMLRNWNKNSKEYIINVWKRQGIQFDKYHIYETNVPLSDFWKGVPISEQAPLDYRNTGTVINVIKEIVTQTSPDDYVLLKVELSDNHDAELQIWNDLLQNRNHVLDYLDEFFYTIPIVDDTKYGIWYAKFSQLRGLGIRAHSFPNDVE